MFLSKKKYLFSFVAHLPAVFFYLLYRNQGGGYKNYSNILSFGNKEEFIQQANLSLSTFDLSFQAQFQLAQTLPWQIFIYALLLIACFVAITAIIRIRTLNKRVQEFKDRLYNIETRWSNAEKVANIGYYEYSVSNGKILWSDTMFDVLGVPKENKELTQEEYYNCIVPENRELVKETIFNSIKTGKGFNIEYALNIKGKHLFIKANGETVKDSKGNVVKLIGTVTDITEQHKVQTRLEQSEERFRLLSNLTFEGILIHKNGVMLDSNQSFLSMFEFNRAELIGENVLQRIIAPEYQKDVDNNVKNRNTTPYEVVCISKSGKKIPVEIESREIIYDGTNARVAALRDISERKKQEVNLAREQWLFSMLMDYIPDSIYFKDLESRFVRVNKAMLKKHGLKVNTDLIGKTDFDIYDDEHAKPAYEDEQKIIKTGKPIIGIVEKEVWHDGRVAWVFTSKLPYYDPEGKLLGTFGISRDITELKKAQDEIKKYSDELKELNASKDRFFSIIAHDLRNPFITLLGFSEMLIEDYFEFTDEEKVEYLKEMEKTSRSSYELLENLLQWSRAQTGRIKYEPEQLDFNKLLNDNIELLGKNSEMKDIDIKTETGESVFVYADNDMIMTVIRNLLTNALKFTQRGGEIKIGSTEEDEYFVFYVSDTGIGMPQEKADSIFCTDAIQTTSGTEGEKGSGLGLVLCKEFIVKHGGKIWVESEENKGTTFYFTLPKYKS